MDYRERKYYLVRFYYYNKCIDILKRNTPSIKIHPPYNHFRNDKAIKLMKQRSINIPEPDIYDGDVCGYYVQVMISCPENRVSELDSILRGIRIYDDPSAFWKEVTKKDLKQ